MKKLLIIMGLVLMLIIAAGAALSRWAVKEESYYFDQRTFPVVLVSDIHMGSQKCEWDQCGPKIEEAFKSVLDSTGNMMIVTAGDNTDASAYSDDQVTASALREGYKAKLLEMTAGREILWANGNHDRQTYLSGNEYYSYDKNNWRFIIIRTTDVVGAQYDWLVEQLKTDKNKIVVMHHPVFHQKNKNVIPKYANLVRIFDEYDVKYVISGHWHAFKYERELDGVVYKALRGLTYRYDTGSKPHYEVMDLAYRMIDVEKLDPRKEKFLYWVHQLLKK